MIDMQNKRLFQLDLLKALAIVGVIILHSKDHPQFLNLFHIDQVVPIFLIIFSLTTAISFRNRGYKKLTEMYGGDHFLERIQKIVIPVLLIFLIPFLQTLLIIGPGYYFIPLLIGFIFLFPILYKIYLYNPKLLLIITFVINFSFEIISRNLDIFKYDLGLYSLAIPRYLFIIALGIWISEDYQISSKRNRFLLVGLAISVLYLILNEFFSYDFFETIWKTQNLVASFYPLALVMLAIKYLPSESKGVYLEAVGLVGKASYHIYLMQILFFTFMESSIWYNIVYSIVLGLVFHLHSDRIRLKNQNEEKNQVQ